MRPVAVTKRPLAISGLLWPRSSRAVGMGGGANFPSNGPTGPAFHTVPGLRPLFTSFRATNRQM